MQFPKRLSDRLQSRKNENAFRSLSVTKPETDFASNDYIGFARSASLFEKAHQLLAERNITHNGATGSRLLSGNHGLYTETESYIAAFHNAGSALIFNSGYDANVGFFSAVPQKGDLILFDELCHASIRDGIQLSNATAYKFRHNDFEHLAELAGRHTAENIYVVTETVFSMDGDTPNLEELAAVCEQYKALMVVDEAHALGVFGENGNGLLQEYGLENRFFARIMTFGKGLGCHGAAILGSVELRDYLVNYARSLIYTTALPPHSLATILVAYRELTTTTAIAALRENITHFNREKNMLSLKPLFIRSASAIQSAVLPGNERVKSVAASLQENGFDVKPILSPTVPAGQERLRFCLHSYNTPHEITAILGLLRNFVS